MLQDYRLGLRMLLKYPGLTLAGGLALAIAIGIGAGAYDLVGKVFAPTIPLPEGDRLVLIETRNTLTNVPEPRVLHDFLAWRGALQTIEDLGAYRTHTRNLVVGITPPEPIQVAELTAAAFGTARVPPLFGRALLASDETPAGPGVVVLGYEVWQRSLGGRDDVLGSVVKLGRRRPPTRASWATGRQRRSPQRTRISGRAWCGLGRHLMIWTSCSSHCGTCLRC
jgi:putative ABC transport system permease protein